VVSAIRVQPKDGDIIIGGAFRTYNGQPRDRLARLKGGASIGFGSFDFLSANYTLVENQTNQLITVVRSGGTSNTVTVVFGTANGTATSGVDYASTNGTLTFAPGVTHQSFNVRVLDNPVPDGTRTVLLTLANPTGGAILGGISSSVLTIQDDDSTVSFSAPAYTVAENEGSATITVVRAGGTNSAFDVSFFTANGTALAGTDYVATNGTLNFANGLTNATFTVGVIDNLTVSGNKTTILFLTNAVGAVTIGAQSNATLTIVDNEFGPGTLSFASTNFIVLENETNASITVTRTNGAEGIVSVNYSTTTNGTATNGANYTAVTGVFTWPDGDLTPRTFQVPINDNFTTNTDRTVNLRLTSPTGGANLGSISNAVLQIQDNDSVFGFSTNSFSVLENSTSVSISVVCINPNDGRTVGTNKVSFATANNTATNGIHYISTNGVLTFVPGQINSSFVVNIIDNTDSKGDVTVRLSLSNPEATPAGSASLSSTHSNATLTIQDNEVGVFFSTNQYTVLESAGFIDISVVRRGLTNQVVAVEFSTINSTAVAGLDYSSVQTNLTLMRA